MNALMSHVRNSLGYRSMTGGLRQQLLLMSPSPRLIVKPIKLDISQYQSSIIHSYFECIDILIVYIEREIASSLMKKIFEQKDLGLQNFS
jgi:hypothetical protein